MAIAKLDTRLEIRRTAKKLFKERGYAATSMRDLAREVGIEAASLYNHLSSKEELLHEMCFDIAEQFFLAFQAAVKDEKSPSKKLKSAIKAHIGVIASNLDASAVFFHEWVFLKNADLTKFKKLRFEYEQGFRDLVLAGIKEKDFKEVNAKMAVFAILSALNATYDLYRSNEKMTPEEITESISNLLLKGLKK
jgi:AcrR family transcriptional regulator